MKTWMKNLRNAIDKNKEKFFDEDRAQYITKLKRISEIKLN